MQTAILREPTTAVSDTILVVDDSPFNLKALSLILERAGYRVLCAHDGDEAINAASAENPDLILLDIRMPGKDGYAVFGDLRRDRTTSEIPIIFLSALEDVSERIRALDLGASDFMSKTFREDEVLARVRTHLRVSHLTRNLSRVNRELLERQRDLERDLHAAGEIQLALLPKKRPRFSGLRVAWRFQPCASVGGDIFNVLPIGAQRYGCYVLDVSGHGVPSSLVAVSVAQSLSSHLTNGGKGPVSPGAILKLLDQEYPIERFDRMFTISLMTLDLKSGRLDFSSAGHPPPILVRRSGEIEQLSEGGALIGLDCGGEFEEGRRKLAKGDRVFLYTDGILESFDARGRMFGPERFQKLLREHNNRDLEEVCDAVMAALHQHGGDRAQDDISLMAVELQPQGGRSNE